MLQTEFLEKLRFRLAESAVGPTALRNQGAPGMIATAREFLKRLDIAPFASADEIGYLSCLDNATVALQRKLQETVASQGRSPGNALYWGTARKALNLFLRDVVYCTDLASHFRLQATRLWLEVPLDSYVTEGLRRYPNLGSYLPDWPGIKYLAKKESDEYQQVGSQIGSQEGIARVDLDVIFWRGPRLVSLVDDAAIAMHT